MLGGGDLKTTQHRAAAVAAQSVPLATGKGDRKLWRLHSRGGGVGVEVGMARVQSGRVLTEHLKPLPWEVKPHTLNQTLPRMPDCQVENSRE